MLALLGHANITLYSKTSNSTGAESRVRAIARSTGTGTGSTGTAQYWTPENCWHLRNILTKSIHASSNAIHASSFFYL